MTIINMEAVHEMTGAELESVAGGVTWQHVVTDTLKGAASGAASGGAKGGSVGAAIGAVVGAVEGFVGSFFD